MTDIVSTKDLRLGMFVAELDRPWLETPFLVQGFLVHEAAQIDAIRACCRFVGIDRARSVGDEYAAPAPAPKGVAPPPQGPPNVVWQSCSPAGLEAAGSGGQWSTPRFIDVLRALRRAPPPRPVTGSADHAPAGDGPDTGPATPSGALAAAGAGPPRAFNVPPRDSGSDEGRDRPRGPGRVLRLAGALSGWVARLRLLRTAARSDDYTLPPNPELEAIVGGQAHALRIAVNTVYWDRTLVEQELLHSRDAFFETQDLIQNLATEMAKERVVDFDRIRDAVTTLTESIVRNPDALMWLSKLKRTDNYTYDHALDVSVHLMAFGRHLGLPLDKLHVLGLAGLMQDLGKINLPLALLKKTEPLTPAERQVMRRHVELSCLILAEQPDLPAEVLDIVAKHHERINGRGYPRQLAGDKLGLFAEMAGIVDTYCALASERPHRPAHDHQRALERIYKQRARGFSASLVLEFVQYLGIYPVGTLVELNTGEVAVVIAQNRIRRLRPRVLVLLGPDKSLNPVPAPIDLIYEPPSPDGTPYRIVRALRPGAYGLDPQEFYL